MNITRRCTWCSDELTDLTIRPVSTVTGLAFCGANPDPEFDDHEPERCPECDGQGSVDFYDNNDARVGGRACSLIDNPHWHPPAPPTPVSPVKPHKCNGLCCPPF